MADGSGVIGEIDRAFLQEGFERDWTALPKVRYRGALNCINTIVSLSVDVPDLEFVSSPEIRVENLSELPSQVLPHVFGPDGNLCYMERTVTVLDRYDPGGTIMFCLKEAKRTLEDAIGGRSEGDIAAEFFGYWTGMAYVDLPRSFRGATAVQSWVAMSDDKPTFGTLVVTEQGKLPETLQRRHKSLAGNLPIRSSACSVLHLPIALTVGKYKDKWPPSNMSDLLAWLGGYAAQYSDLIRKTILSGEESSWLTVLRARNGDFLALAKLPAVYDTPEFTKTRRAKLPDLVLKLRPQEIAIERHTGWPISSDYIFERNLNGMTNLANKRIMLIGCGTIGGFLAQQMAQSGAGAGERGELHLVDDDLLTSANLGRHLLGVPYLGQNKAEGCKEFLTTSVMHVNIRATASNALELKSMMSKYDLLVDATGEEAFSIALNQHAIDAAPKFPPILFSWLSGNGAATQAFFFEGGERACFKCLKPIMNEPHRYSMLREDPRFVRNLACGDSAYVPFPVSRSVQAASLALEMILSWAKNDIRHRLQGRVLDSDLAKGMKDGNPEKSTRCPACQTS